MKQRDIEAENRVMEKTITIRDVRQHKDIVVGTDGYDVFELSVKPVRVGKDDYELRKAWYLIPPSWRKVKAIEELR